jgi:hypothetical protein
MNAALEFHDSEVSSVECTGSTLCVRFAAAYVHHSEGRPGSDAGAGYVQTLELLFHEAQWSGNVQLCFGRLSDGQLREGEHAMSLVPLPYQSSTAVGVELAFQNGERLSIKAVSAVIRFTGEPRFVESYGASRRMVHRGLTPPSSGRPSAAAHVER